MENIFENFFQGKNHVYQSWCMFQIAQNKTPGKSKSDEKLLCSFVHLEISIMEYLTCTECLMLSVKLFMFLLKLQNRTRRFL